jgi:EmrB/QacA subfamily drug resistance transporter
MQRNDAIATQDASNADAATNVRTVFIGLMLGMLIAAVNLTIVAPAMPRIVAELGGMAHYSWVEVSVLLASTVIVPIVGKLSDLYGRKAFYVGGILSFVAGTTICGLAPSFMVFIVGRIVQGFGIGTMQPLSQAIVGDLIAPRDRAKYQGLMGAVFGISSIVGPLLGGYITDNLSWRWLFFVNVPVAALALAVIIPSMHLPKVRRPHVIDYPGIISLTVALTSTMLATIWGGTQYRWSSPIIIGLYVVGALALATFIVVERRAVEPVIPLGLWRSRTFTFTNVATLCVGTTMYGAIFFLPVFIQGVLGLDATASGAVMIPMTLSMVAMSTVSGRIVSRTGRTRVPMLIGATLLVLGYWLLTLLDRTSTSATIVRDMIVFGLGLGVLMPMFTLIAQSSVAREDLGVATSTNQLFRSVGSTIGVAVLGTILAQGMASEIPKHVPAAYAEQFAHGGQAHAGAGALFRSGGHQLPPEVTDGIRSGLSVVVRDVLFVGMPFALLALAACIAIPETLLHETHAPRHDVREAGRELLAELNTAGEDDDEPILR